MSIKTKIISLFSKSKDLTVKEIVEQLMVSKQAVHIVLNRLQEEGIVQKFGRTPKTIYRIKEAETGIASDKKITKLLKADEKLLEEEWLVITEIGEILTGKKAFEHWCQARNQPVEKTLDEYKKTIEKYRMYKNTFGLIDGIQKLKNTEGYEEIFLDNLIYVDFYAIERFGKTKLGTLLHYAKQGQNKMLMKRMTDLIKDQLLSYIKYSKADAIGFVPPTIKREVQIMKFIETHIKVNLPRIAILKVSGLIPVPQKSLSKLKERIRNAENTFAVTETNKYKHVILIDDAVGSGSTLNQIAGKIKEKKVAKKVTGLAIVGSFKGFDVITDV
jgi:DNA-binding transcriptional regulator GbsR (MarR family)